MNDRTLLQQAVEALKPCPFCGGAPEDAQRGVGDEGYYAIECPTCRGLNNQPFVGVHGDERALCVTAWNRRPESALQQQEVPSEPVAMLLFCPDCGEQHVDAPDEAEGWTNPPHKSHLCHYCGCIWRPANVPTNGIAGSIARGRADTWSLGEGAIPTAPASVQALIRSCYNDAACFPEAEDPRTSDWMYDDNHVCAEAIRKRGEETARHYVEWLASSPSTTEKPVRSEMLRQCAASGQMDSAQIHAHEVAGEMGVESDGVQGMDADQLLRELVEAHAEWDAMHWSQRNQPGAADRLLVARRKARDHAAAPGVPASGATCPKCHGTGANPDFPLANCSCWPDGARVDADNLTRVDRGALQMALNVLRRAGKNEVADALEQSAPYGVAVDHQQVTPEHPPMPGGKK